MIWLDRTETSLGLLTIVEGTHTELTDALDYCEFECLEPVEKLHRVLWQDDEFYWHEHIVQYVEQMHDGDGVLYKVKTINSLAETQGDWVDDIRPDGITAALALGRIIDTTRWTIGSVTVAGTASATFYRTSFYECLKLIVQNWGGEIVTSITYDGTTVTQRSISIAPSKGTDRGKRFVYGKDIVDVTRTVLSEPIITALKGYGKGEEIGDGYGRRLDFSSVNGGLDYVTNDTALAIYGRLTPLGTRAHIFAKVEFDEVTDPTLLKTLTEAELAKMSVPQIEYEANVVDLSKYGYTHEGTGIGDAVNVIDDVIGLAINARVISIERDLLGLKPDEIKLGNYKKSIADYNAEMTRLLSDFRTRSGVWDKTKIINADNTINASIVTGLITEFNELMNVSMPTGVTTARPGGFLFENTTYGWATEIGVSGIRIANTKNPDGSWNWTTLATGTGLAADVVGAEQIIAGSISSDHITTTGLDANVITVTGGYDLDTYVTQIRNDQISLAQTIGDLKAGNSNLLMNTEFGTSASPSDYWWVIQNATTWNLLKARYDTWAELQGRSLTWNGLKTYNW